MTKKVIYPTKTIKTTKATAAKDFLATALTDICDQKWKGCIVSGVKFIHLTNPAIELAGIMTVAVTLPDNQLHVYLITEMAITHPDTALTIHYLRRYEKKQHPTDDGSIQANFKAKRGEITLLHVENSQNIDIQKALPLVTMLRMGNVRPRGQSKYTPDQQSAIVQAWFDSGKGTQKEQAEFAEERGIAARTLRRWIKRYRKQSGQ